MPSKNAGPSEARIMQHILAQLQSRFPNDLWERRNVIAVRAEDRFVRANKKGTADISGCHLGRYIEIEVKRPGEVQSMAQRARETVIQRAGGVYGVATCLSEALAIVEGAH